MESNPKGFELLKTYLAVFLWTPCFGKSKSNTIENTAEVRPVAGGARFVYLNYLHRIIQQPKMNKSLANAKKPFLDGYQNASEITSRRIFYYVRT